MTNPGMGGIHRGLYSGSLQIKRYVYFSFHYSRDIFRVQQVRNHWVPRGNYAAAGWFDGSLEEKAKKESVVAVKKAIDDGMKGSSVTVVLIGSQTCTRRWVAYEIFRSVELGKGIFGIRIHQLRDPLEGADPAGKAPFENLAYVARPSDGKFVPYAFYDEVGWQEFPLANAVEASASPYLSANAITMLGAKFRIYDWIDHNGYENFPGWVDAAAQEAKR